MNFKLHKCIYLIFLSAYFQDEDRKKGGLTISRYQELFAQFLGDTGDDCPAKHLFGPLAI